MTKYHTTNNFCLSTDNLNQKYNNQQFLCNNHDTRFNSRRANFPPSMNTDRSSISLASDVNERGFVIIFNHYYNSFYLQPSLQKQFFQVPPWLTKEIIRNNNDKENARKKFKKSKVTTLKFNHLKAVIKDLVGISHKK